MPAQLRHKKQSNQRHRRAEGETPIRLGRLEGATRAPIIDTFSNPNPDRDYEINFTCPEFTCVCPKTGQPDFATIKINYIPDQKCIELKSLKLYLWSYRNEGMFHEAVTNKILDALVAATSPRFMEVVGDFFVRGGIHTVVTAKFEKEK